MPNLQGPKKSQRQSGHTPHSQAQRSRSRGVNFGFFTERCRTPSALTRNNLGMLMKSPLGHRGDEVCASPIFSDCLRFTETTVRFRLPQLTLKIRSLDSLARFQQSEPAERLLNRRDLFRRARIFFRCGSGRREAEQLFAVRDPGALGNKAVLTRDPFLDFLIRGTLASGWLVARMRMPVSLIVIANAHLSVCPSV